MSSNHRRTRLVVALVAVAAVAVLPHPAAAQQCQYSASKTPADPPPSILWNRLEPAYGEGGILGCGPYPGNPSCEGRDTTWFDTGHSPWMGTPWWESIDIEQGYAFLATNLGFQIWNLNGANFAENPDRISYPDIRVFSPTPLPGGHGWYLTRDMDADATGNLAAVTGLNLGMLIVDTSNKSQPKALYQDPGDDFTSPEKHGWEVHTATIDGRVYGFLGGYAENSTARDGVWAYDMTRAKEWDPFPPCVEHVPSPNPACSGVFKGRISTKKVGHIDGAGDGSDHFVVASGGLPVAVPQFRWGFQIWNVSNVANGGPFPSVLTGHTTSRIDGVALWREGSRYLLALANRQQEMGQIYDVTCIKTGSCGSLPTPLYQFPLGFNGDTTTIATVQDSFSNGTPWVYFGRRNVYGVQGLQNEWLLDVTAISGSNPPDEITGGDPQNGNQGQPTIVSGGVTVGYWSYMYPCHPSGSNFFRPVGGVVHNNRFYRAGNSIFDIHRLRNVAPTITVNGPDIGYTGQTVAFNATASNCTPIAGGWSWTATGGGQVVGGGTTANAQVQWSTTGQKSVSASNTGCPGANSVPKTIDILDPAPAIGGVSASPTNAPICTPITFTANNVTGQPPLTFAWTIEQGGNPVPGEGGPGNPFVWDTEGIAPGSYVGRVNVNGPGGGATATSPTVTLTALQPLPSPGYAITYDEPPNFGTVQFHSAAATGATEWRWDFDGDLNGPVAFDLVTTDPVIGPNPVHEYSAIGTYRVWLEVRNCTTQTWVRSARLDVTITEISPLLIDDFRAQCPFGVCTFNTGQSITFFHDVEGNPDAYEYDWTNSGSDPFQVEQSSPTPVATHTYAAAGSYRPILRIRRGTETVSFTHAATIVVSTGGPPPTPSITVSGPPTREIGQAGTYTAFASNCTPNTNGWSWNTSGGSGSSDTSSITVSWSSTGTKTVTATNTGCGTTSGTRVVAVTDPGGPGPNPGNLDAAFTVSPAAPIAGQAVTFDASSSGGDPTGWSWEFGDGGIGSGELVTHVFAEPGVYQVELMVSKVIPGSGCGAFGQEICINTTTTDVTVGDGDGACVPDDTTLCLLGGRFEVTAHWHNQRNGEQGMARVYTPFSGDRTGMLWFFRPDNVELIVKALDATNPEIFPNPAFWIFYGGLSDVEYWINVTDTADPEALPKEYHNLPGVICGVPDTGAFPQGPPNQQEPVYTGGALFALGAAAAGGADEFDGSAIFGGASGTCTPTGENLCLLDGRFSVEVDWHDQHNDTTGIGHPVVGTDRTGYFWFFNSDNIELVAKMINGAVVNDHFWVLWGGLSDVEYTIRVTDTVTGTPREFHNDPGNFCGGASANAFPSP